MINISPFEYGPIAILTSLTHAVITGFILLTDRRRPVTLIFGLYTLMISAWAFCWYKMVSVNTYEGCLFWARCLHYPASLIPATFLHFTQHLLGISGKARQKTLRYLIYITAVFFLLLVQSNSFIASVSPKAGFKYYIDLTPTYLAFTVFFIVTVIIIHLQIIGSLKQERGIKRTQIAYILGAYALGYIGGASAFFPIFGLPMPIIFLYLIPVGHLIIAYATIRYRVLEFSLVIRWGIACSFTIGIVAALFFLGVIFIEKVFMHHFQGGKGLSTLTLTCVAVLIFEPTRNRIYKLVDTLIFRSPDFQLILAGIEKELSEFETAELTAQGLMARFKAIWNVNHAGLIIWNPARAEYEPVPSVAFNDQIIGNMNDPIRQTDFLVKTLETERRLFQYGIVVQEEVISIGNHATPGERTTLWKIRRTMRWLGAAICVPLMTKDQLRGFIVLGDKKDRASYNAEDKKFLSHIAELVSPTIEKFIQLKFGDMNEHPIINH